MTADLIGDLFFLVEFFEAYYPKIGLSLVSVFELSIEQKNHDLVKEEVEILNLELKIKDREIGRMMKKLAN